MNKTIKPNGYPEIELIMKEMWAWNYEEKKAIKQFVIYEKKQDDYPFLCIDKDGDFDCFVNVKPIEEPKPRTIQDGLKYGDIIVNEDGRRKVLAVIDEVIIISYSDNFHETASFYTLRELIQIGYKLEQELQPESEETVFEMTVAEISEALGKNVKIIK